MKQILLFCLFSLCHFVTAAEERSKQPNIIFIFADDWGWGDLSLHGSTFCKTPNLDSLAKTGTDFHGFSVASGVCSPSRAAIMTGHYPARYGIHQHFATLKHHLKTDMPDWLPPDGVMLPRLLKQAGYVTAHFGKWHLTNIEIKDAPLPADYGYDESCVFNGPGPQVNANPNVDKPLETDMAIDFIQRHKNKPLFINLWIHSTHLPHYPTERWMEKFKELDEKKRVYAAVVAEADERIGAVLKKLDEIGIADNTLVIFSSDNGPEDTGSDKTKGDASTGDGLANYYSVGTTGGLRGRKRSLFNGGVGVPFLARWPGMIPEGRTDTSSVLTGVDILPTLCAIAGAKLPPDYTPDGVNILPALRGEKFDREKMIFTEWRPGGKDVNWPQLGVRDGKWTLLMKLDGSRVELFDTSIDRSQRRDHSHPIGYAWRATSLELAMI